MTVVVFYCYINKMYLISSTAAICKKWKKSAFFFFFLFHLIIDYAAICHFGCFLLKSFRFGKQEVLFVDIMQHPSPYLRNRYLATGKTSASNHNPTTPTVNYEENFMVNCVLCSILEANSLFICTAVWLFLYLIPTVAPVFQFGSHIQ